MADAAASVGYLPRVASAFLVAAALLAGGCATPIDGESPRAEGSATASSQRLEPVSKVLVVIEENHSFTQMREGMPFLARVSDTYGYATHWSAITHPSAPNYLAIAGGSTFGVTTDAAPAADAEAIGDSASVFDQAISVGRTAGTYAESMPQGCHVYDYPDRSDGVPKYAVRHNPWTYFSAGRDDCSAHDQDLASFADDAAANALPDVGFLIPNLDHDAHDGTLAVADDWLAEQLRPVLGSEDFTSGRLVVIVTADEDDKHSDNQVLTSVLTPRLSHVVVDTALTHYSLTRYLASVLGVRPLRDGAHAPDLREAFGL